MLYYTILYWTIPYYSILFYTILHYTILYYTLLHSIILYYAKVLYYTILYYAVLYRLARRCSGVRGEATAQEGLRGCRLPSGEARGQRPLGAPRKYFPSTASHCSSLSSHHKGVRALVIKDVLGRVYSFVCVLRTLWTWQYSAVSVCGDDVSSPQLQKWSCLKAYIYLKPSSVRHNVSIPFRIHLHIHVYLRKS